MCPAVSLTILMKKGEDMHPKTGRIVLYEFPKAIFLWPLIPLGFISWALAHLGTDPETLGWIYLSVFSFVLVAVTVDVDRNTALVLVLVAIIFILGGLFAASRAIPIFGWISQRLANLDITFHQGMAWFFTVLSGVLVGYSLLWALFNGKWLVTPNEIQHFSIGKQDYAIARAAKSVVIRYSDYLEFLIGFSGSIVVLRPNSQEALYEIPHVLFLPWKKHLLDRLLELREVTTAQIEDDETDPA